MKRNLYSIFLVFVALLLLQNLQAQNETYQNKFKQLKDELATPNVYRTASGAPGHEYWQQKADYDIEIELDDRNHRIHGIEKITYTNNSPDDLTYIWLQLDQNVRAKDADSYKVSTDTPLGNRGMSTKSLLKLHNNFEGGFNIEHIKDQSKRDLKYTINQTMMRIDLPQVLKSKSSFSFEVKWWYNINNRLEMGGRSGYEYFEKDDNYAYTIAQFFPRMAVYNEVEGWQNKQFLGDGEFAVPFGDYQVSITLPSDYVVAATGELQNASSVLTSEQRSRLQKARTAKEPVLIITQEEAEANEKASRSTQQKTWRYQAKSVRDFAIAASRKFMWDAMGVPLSGKTVMAQSLYPKEGNPLWGQYSTKVAAHTLRTYSKYTFDYPYPVATSVHAKVMGMEYPMICFNFGRPDEDGTYSEYIKFRMIGVIVHEIGHNYFPMIVNSDERQWAWMDEGLNTFLQYLTEQEWDRNFPSRRGPAYKIVDYMKGDKKNMVPIMSSPNTIRQLGNNAYGKPAIALNILRETVMGRELFDFAFKTYAQRWKFKHPSPEDFFRTMEDASAVDLDWFWRGWFYSTDHVDIAIEKVVHFQANTLDADIEKPLDREKAEYLDKTFISDVRNQTSTPQTIVERDEAARDFYDEYDPFEVTDISRKKYDSARKRLPERVQEIIAKEGHYYEITFSNIGGLVMPLILQFNFVDNTSQEIRIPAEIWQRNPEHITKLFPTEKEVVSIQLDPHLETADTDTYNNSWPPKAPQNRFRLFKEQEKLSNGNNPMKRAKRGF